MAPKQKVMIQDTSSSAAAAAIDGTAVAMHKTTIADEKKPCEQQ